MHSSDIEFFEQYKRLDKLCGEIYSCRGGISAYIDDMESVYAKGLRSVPMWAHDFKMLKHVRWVRNQIAHEGSDYCVSEGEDVDFIYDFYDRIFDGEDPISQLEKAASAPDKKSRKTQQVQRNEKTYGDRDEPRKNGGCVGCLVFMMLLLAAIFAGLIYLLFFRK